MSTPAPAPRRHSFALAAWRPSGRALLWVALAFVVGLLLFALVWSRRSKSDDFYRADSAPPTAASQQYEPLPAPLPAGSAASASRVEPIGRDRRGDEARPRLVETVPPPPTVALPPPRPAPAAAAPVTLPMPIAGQTPAPRYPARALRRGDAGTVRVRAEIGPDGVPTSVSVQQSSGSRELDRAAVDAVRRWRFNPARRNGQPTVGTVVVPISFNPN